MTNNHADELFTGRLVRLIALNPAEDAGLIASWARDPWYDRLFTSDPAYPTTGKNLQSWMEGWLEDSYGFLVRTLADDAAVGWLDLSGINWVTGNGWVGIAIGSRDQWGKGYGTDAMRILVRYAFEVLNLRRITLSTFEYNRRAIRSYEKIGFKLEGRARQALVRDGRCWDILYMGLLRSEWQPQ